MIRNIDINKIKTLLKFEGINVDVTDEELQILVESKLKELEGIINADIYPQDRTDIQGSFKGKVYELINYPVLNIHRVFINDKCVHKEHFNVNYDVGIIYFDKTYYDVNIRIQYTTGIPDYDFEFLIIPLIKDMVGYTITSGLVNSKLGGLNGFVTSLHEGDVSMSFGNGNGGSNNNYGYNAGVNSKIDELKNRYLYSARVRFI